MNTLMKSQLDTLTQDLHDVTKQGIDSMMPLKNDTVVITGGTGFIGTWVTGLLTHLNDFHQFNTQIVLVARHTDAFKSARPHLANRRDVSLIQADIRHFSDIPDETNWLIHAASSPDNRTHATYPIETMSTIAEGTYSILRSIERCSNFKMLVNLSSGHVYGSQPLELNMLNEQFTGAPNCNSASSAYAEAKRYAETLCHASRSQARMPAVNIRPFAFIGPYQSLERPWAINNFIKDAISGKKIRILGDGDTVRSYMYASDMAYWILSILTGSKSGEIYNLGSPEGITLKSLAERISAQFEKRPDIELRVAGNQPKSTRFIPDVTLATQRLGLKLTVDLDLALLKTINWNKLQ